MNDEFEILVSNKKEELNESIEGDAIVHALEDDGSYFIFDETIEM